MLVQ
jgi:hypothetical protein